MVRRSSLRRVTLEKRGTSVVEFGLMAPILFSLFMGTIDFARGFTHKFWMEQSAYRTLEKISAGSLQTDYTQFEGEAAQAAGVNEADVEITSWLECEGVRQADFNAICAEGEQVTRYVRIAIQSFFQLSFPTGPLATSAGTADEQGRLLLQTASTLRVQ